MLRINYQEDKYISISEYIYNNYDKFILNKDIENYIDKSKLLIDKYENIWPTLNRKQVISNFISLNLFILNNYI